MVPVLRTAQRPRKKGGDARDTVSGQAGKREAGSSVLEHGGACLSAPGSEKQRTPRETQQCPQSCPPPPTRLTAVALSCQRRRLCPRARRRRGDVPAFLHVRASWRLSDVSDRDPEGHTHFSMQMSAPRLRKFLFCVWVLVLNLLPGMRRVFVLGRRRTDIQPTTCGGGRGSFAQRPWLRLYPCVTVSESPQPARPCCLTCISENIAHPRPEHPFERDGQEP